MPVRESGSGSKSPDTKGRRGEVGSATSKKGSINTGRARSRTSSRNNSMTKYDSHGGSKPASKASVSSHKKDNNSSRFGKSTSRVSKTDNDTSPNRAGSENGQKQDANGHSESPERTMSPKEENDMGAERQDSGTEEHENVKVNEDIDNEAHGEPEPEEVRRSSKASIPIIKKIDPEDFDSKTFLVSLAEVKESLQSDTFRTIDDNYPAEELNAMVTAITTVMENFKDYSLFTQRQMESVRDEMKDITTKMQKRIQQRSYDPRSGKQWWTKL